jgi:predicted nucleic acid-binding protein
MVLDHKTAIMDASSAIILDKADLHLRVAEMYNVVMPESVYCEITGNAYPAAEKYKRLLTDKKITVQKIDPGITDQPGMVKLDQGEYDVLRLYYAGYGDFVITDDGAAARYCKRENIPFINALLVPLILSFTDTMRKNKYNQAYRKILAIGRYSSAVISFADRCDRDKLLNFMP